MLWKLVVLRLLLNFGIMILSKYCCYKFSLLPLHLILRDMHILDYKRLYVRLQKVILNFYKGHNSFNPKTENKTCLGLLFASLGGREILWTHHRQTSNRCQSRIEPEVGNIVWSCYWFIYRCQFGLRVKLSDYCEWISNLLITNCMI